MTEERKAFNIAENIFSVMCALMKNLPKRMEYIRNNGMLWFNDPLMCQTYNMSLGFYGFDNAAHKLLSFSKAFDMAEFYAYAPKRESLPDGVERVGSLAELFEKSKIVSVHNAAETEIIGPEHFAKLRDGGMYINLYDAKIRDENALMRELESGRIRAGLIGWHKNAEVTGKWNNLIMIGDSLR